jgi:hypothetical protein
VWGRVGGDRGTRANERRACASGRERGRMSGGALANERGEHANERRAYAHERGAHANERGAHANERDARTSGREA